MRAELKSLFSMEIPGPMNDYHPDDPEHFGIRVMAFIGAQNDEQSDSFDLLVCSPSWLAEHFADPRISRWKFEDAGLLFGNRFLFMTRWDYDKLHATIVDLCAIHEADDWGTLANRIGRHIPWEFDYKYDKFIDQTAASRPPFPPKDPSPPDSPTQA